MGPTVATEGGRAPRVGQPYGRCGSAGLTLIELIVAFSLMLILSLMALPVASVRVQREQERQLRYALHEIRTAIDRHKDMADDGLLSALDPENFGYPESLDALVEGIELSPEAGAARTERGQGGALRGDAGDDPLRRGRSDPFGSGSRAATGFGSDRPESENPAFGSGRDPFGQSSRPFDSDRGQPETMRFLRQIPTDPMTGQREWGLLSVSDDPMSRSWSGRNVFDVYSLSSATALDGTRYSEW